MKRWTLIFTCVLFAGSAVFSGPKTKAPLKAFVPHEFLYAVVVPAGFSPAVSEGELRGATLDMEVLLEGKVPRKERDPYGDWEKSYTKEQAKQLDAAKKQAIQKAKAEGKSEAIFALPATLQKSAELPFRNELRCYEKGRLSQTFELPLALNTEQSAAFNRTHAFSGEKAYVYAVAPSAELFKALSDGLKGAEGFRLTLICGARAKASASPSKKAPSEVPIKTFVHWNAKAGWETLKATSVLLSVATP